MFSVFLNKFLFKLLVFVQKDQSGQFFAHYGKIDSLKHPWTPVMQKTLLARQKTFPVMQKTLRSGAWHRMRSVCEFCWFLYVPKTECHFPFWLNARSLQSAVCRECFWCVSQMRERFYVRQVLFAHTAGKRAKKQQPKNPHPTPKTTKLITC